MITVFKYALEAKSSLKAGAVVFPVPMPVGADILSTGYQDGVGAVVWASVDTDDAPTEVRYLAALPTGGEMPPVWEAKFIGRMEPGGGLVFHVFELIFEEPPS